MCIVPAHGQCSICSEFLAARISAGQCGYCRKWKSRSAAVRLSASARGRRRVCIPNCGSQKKTTTVWFPVHKRRFFALNPVGRIKFFDAVKPFCGLNRVEKLWTARTSYNSRCITRSGKIRSSSQTGRPVARGKNFFRKMTDFPHV